MVARELGPYNKPDGRKIMTLVASDGSRTTIQYARYLMSNVLDRPITNIEVVHHLDGDWTNDDLSNLEVIALSEHSKLHNTNGAEYFYCPCCMTPFELSGKRLSAAKYRLKKNKSQVFCSKHCAGIKSKENQNG
jgi:hypothetical protein